MYTNDFKPILYALVARDVIEDGILQKPILFDGTKDAPLQKKPQTPNHFFDENGNLLPSDEILKCLMKLGRKATNSYYFEFNYDMKKHYFYKELLCSDFDPENWIHSCRYSLSIFDWYKIFSFLARSSRDKKHKIIWDTIRFDKRLTEEERREKFKETIADVKKIKYTITLTQIIDAIKAKLPAEIINYKLTETIVKCLQTSNFLGTICYIDFNNNAYSFDENSILHIQKVEGDQSSPIYPSFLTPYSQITQAKWKAAVSKWKENMSLQECIDIFAAITESDYEAHLYSEIERLCTKIEKPRFERDPENLNPKTFDRIHIDVYLNTSMFEDRKKLVAHIRENRNKIDDLVLQKIKDSKQFQHYNIPLGFLRLTNIILRKYSMEYIFTLSSL